MTDAEVTTGPTEVVASGTVTPFDGEPVEITLQGDSEALTIVCAFEADDGEQRVETEVLDESTLRFAFINFANPLGSGSTRPVEVGTLDGRPLLFHFRVHAIEGSDPVLGYTFYLREVQDLTEEE